MKENIFLFVPNLIGYARIITGLWACFILDQSPVWALALYSISGLLDAVDGTAARALNQGTRFGAVLDMVTDRSATACLVVYLAHVYPQWMFGFQLLIALDLSSHYFQMVSSLTLGLDSHKSLKDSAPWLLRLYYTNRLVLFLVCAGNEAFFVGLYATYWFDSALTRWIVLLTSPVFVLKQLLNLVQLVDASRALGLKDQETRRKGKSKE